mgnify:FL=1
MAKKTEVACWKSIMAKLDYKMDKDKLERLKKVREAVNTQKKGKK